MCPSFRKEGGQDGFSNNSFQSGASEDESSHLDGLTGLPNRLSALKYLRAIGEKAAMERCALALIVIDIDRFREVNELTGFSAGDALLSEVAKRLRTILKSDEYASRISGDEFLVIVNGENAALVTARCEEIIQTLAPRLRISNADADITLSVGVAIYANGRNDTNELLREATIALALAKGDGGAAVRYYDDAFAVERQAQIELRREMERALILHQFSAAYQLVFDLRISRFTGAEALIRWNHPRWGVLAPPDFLRTAEESSVISRIDTWMVDQVSAQLAAWIQAKVVPVNFVISVNISSRDICDDRFLMMLRECVERHQIRPENIELEVTEEMVMRDFERTVRSLNSLRSFGVGISLDHFGENNSNLDCVRRFPISRLKLDRKFTRNLDKDAKALLFVDSTIKLAKSMKVGVVAQGVETDQQRLFFAEMGCDFVQGYVVGRPLAPNALEKFLRQHTP